MAFIGVTRRTPRAARAFAQGNRAHVAAMSPWPRLCSCDVRAPEFTARLLKENI
jgi:hypothetical protein